MFSSTGSSPAQQVPAWKRLGLKLKQPAAASEPAIGGPTGGVGHPSSSPGKRKLDAPPAANYSQVAKRPRTDEAQTTPGRNGQGQLRKQKSVTFADAPTNYAHTPAPPKKSKGPAKKKQPPPTTDLKPALEYLRLWKTARDSWKFNKNHQAALIKHVFDANGIPAADIETFYDYIQDLKGFIRMRLRETALEIRTKDQSDGKSGFPEGTKDVDTIQERYETILTRFLDAQQAGQKRKGYSEAEYLSTSEDGKLIIQRLVKRLRAELVLDELSESGESGQTETSTTSSSTETIAASENNTTTTSDADKRVKEFNDGTGKRRRKLRTANMDSSSESESEDDSDTSSSGSSSSDESSDDDEEEEEATTQQGNGYETTSSSSSSSSEEGSDDESGDESD
ncbi:Fc.00g101420.m01.CDS01 [Cosmosporella sp. VM-42]